MRRYVIYGAGGIGGTIGLRLHRAGAAVSLIARGAHARAIQQQGLKLRAPEGVHEARIPCFKHPTELPWLSQADTDLAPVVMLCMKSQHTERALRDLCAVGLRRDLPIVCVQNGVANEPLALRYFRTVYATVVNVPALHLTPGEVVTHAQGQGGILDTGRFPQGVDDLCHHIVADLSQAGFSAMADPAVMRQKYAKLLLNLANVLQAGLQDTAEVTDLLRAARKEALACYAAAGVDCMSKSAVDERRQGVYTLADLPDIARTGGSSWQSVARGAPDIETEFLNGEICLLGRRHNVPTPVNDACVEMGRQIVASGAGPGQFPVADLRALVAEAEQASQVRNRGTG